MLVTNFHLYTSVRHHVNQRKYIRLLLFLVLGWSYFLITNAETTKDPATGTESSGSLYPAELFTDKELEEGAVVLHVIGVIYMFIALAIVCDEFFVPALGVITERLQISEDVAGATFMAAGGSAPELFTSLIGTFFSKNDVGIGTIVGSAVFNILFVIGMCSFSSLTILTLTWWPLFRDICFYSVSLVCLIAFFEDSQIEVYESLILFGCYICYVVFMKFNDTFERKVNKLKDRCCGKKSRLSKDGSVLMLGSGSINYRQRKSIAQILVSHDDQMNIDALSDTDKASVTGGPSPVEINLGNQLDDVESIRNSIHTDSDEKKSRMASTFSLASKKNDKRSSHGSSELSTDFTHSVHNRTASKTPSLLSEVQPNASETEKALSSKFDTASEKIENVSNEESVATQEKKEMPEEVAEPLDMSFPSGCKDRVTYILLFPIMFSLWMTLPDVRKESNEKFFVLTFAGSIAWIGGFSFCMVWWANTIGDTIGIPAEIMGITVLAAGTSVPDLITSVIVAKKGFGDMAVSSSVGSNIFDITVGLPIPWLLQAAVTQGGSYQVGSSGLFCSIVLLFAMLIAVVVSIAASGWKMKRILGVCMMILYVIFVVFAVLLTKNIINCDDIQNELFPK